MKNKFISKCKSVVGEKNLLLDSDMNSYLTDWRKRFTGNAIAVIKPSNKKEISEIIKLCIKCNVSIVPQGGNTGLVLGSVPEKNGNSIVISLSRLNKILEVDLKNNTMMVEAGCLLKNIQNIASENEKLFPLSMASEGSCTIGGNLSTNAGGTAVLRYGNIRDLTLGIECVTANGEIWDGLKGLRKDNTGYDLKNLFIGSEGTLGIITTAVLKLFPKPLSKLTCFCAFENMIDAVSFLELSQKMCDANLTSFEVMSDYSIELVEKHFKNLKQPFNKRYNFYSLIELSDFESEEHSKLLIESLISIALEKNIIHDAVIANSIKQSKIIWSLRENISLAQSLEGSNIKHDISLPISKICEFVNETNHLITKNYPGSRIVNFGHLGDGNLHYNISAPLNICDSLFLNEQEKINIIVYDNVDKYKGSISAEHGLGKLKQKIIKKYKSDVEIDMMKSIKKSLDPFNIMNPGKII